MKLTIDNFKSMMNLSLANVKAREEEFSKLDAIAGDGDHGTAIVTALTIIAGDAQQGTESGYAERYGDGRDDENQRIHQYPVRCFIYGDGRSLGTARGDG